MQHNCNNGSVSVTRFSAIHFRGESIRQVSCYTLPAPAEAGAQPLLRPVGIVDTADLATKTGRPREGSDLLGYRSY